MRKRNGNRGSTAVAIALLLVGFGSWGCGGENPALTTCEAADGVEPICGFNNPEDLALLPGGSWLVVSQMPKGFEGTNAPGSVVAWRPSDETLTLYPQH